MKSDDVRDDEFGDTDDLGARKEVSHLSHSIDEHKERIPAA